MATIPVTNDQKTFQIQRFLGINESNDGDTQLKMGEAAVLNNWEVTDEYHLRVRPGVHTVKQFENPVRGLWSGYVAGKQYVLCAADGAVWDVTDTDSIRRLGDCVDADTHFFGFGGKVYILNGSEYLMWDGEGYVDTVSGYVPVVITAAEPVNGSGTELERVNLLTGRRRVRYSADGTTTVYKLPESGLQSIDKVTVNGATTSVTKNLTAGTITFTTAPLAGSNNVEVWYTVVQSLRAQVEGMRFSEFFNGANESRVFLYGDGTANAIYCGITEDGIASAEYFPDLNVMQIGEENTPLTAMIKHYDRLISLKSDGCFATQYDTTTLADGTVTSGYYTVPLNRDVGNECPGQVRLVNNYPRSIFANACYDWKMTSRTVRDERNAELVSEKVQQSMLKISADSVRTFDDESSKQYYIFLNDEAGTVLVNRYHNGVWYIYTGIPANCAVRFGKEVYLGLTDGRLALFSHEWTIDDSAPIEAEYRSGMMDFGLDSKRKHSSVIYVSLKPAANARIIVSAASDKKAEYNEKEVTTNVASFDHSNFLHWSFNTMRNPQMKRVKLKVKKFVYYQLVIKSVESYSETTVLGADMTVRYTGNVK